MYDIKVYYETGDSFSNYSVVEKIGHSWKSKEDAQMALVYIKEHYKAYQKANGYTREHIDVSREPWFDKDGWQYRLLVPDGDEMVCISPFWCGYFEALNGASIVEDDDKNSFEL